MFQGRVNGKSVRITIGDTSAWTLEKARAKARELQIMIDGGRDPRQVKAEMTAVDAANRAQADRDRAPARDAWEHYLKVRAAKWSDRTLLDHERLNDAGGKPKKRGRKKGEGDTTLPGPLFALLRLPLAKINRTAVSEWLREQQHRPTVARNAFVRLRAFINWCAEQPEYKEQARVDACNKHVLIAELPKPAPKEDCLQREQLAVWFKHVLEVKNPVMRAYLQMALLTGARREEIAMLLWSDVDFQWNSIRLRDKVDSARIIPLTPCVKSLLLELKHLNEIPPSARVLKRMQNQGRTWEPSKFVFFSRTSTCGRIKEPRGAHERALRAAGLPHLTIHGLRRSFGTLAEWTDCPAGVIAQIQGHKPSAIAEKHYRRRSLDFLRHWHTIIESWFLREAGLDQSCKELPSQETGVSGKVREDAVTIIAAPMPAL